MTSEDINLIIADDCASFYADPYGWVLYAFDWGHGELEGYDGPDKWQTDLLKSLGEEISARGFDGVNAVEATRYAIASGHG